MKTRLVAFTKEDFVISEIPDKGLYCFSHERKFVQCERHMLTTKGCRVLRSDGKGRKNG